jgi:tryptophan synthase alpha chain
LVERARCATELPLYAGFGISTPEQARAAARLADGIVVGTSALEAAEKGAEALAAYVENLRGALDCAAVPA